MKYNKIIFLYLLTIITKNIKCDEIITFFFKPFPTNNANIAAKRASKISIPGKLQKYTLKAMTKSHLTAGIFCIYSGYITTSDLNGQVIFPRKHIEPKITIIVTRSITPIIMLENTVHHWEIANRNITKMYEVERKHDAATRAYFWDTKEVKIPADNIISEDSIVIIANPKHVYIAEGIIPTIKDPQLLLPNIYIKNNIEKLSNSLYIFNIKNFLAPTNNIFKKDKMSYSQQIKE